MRREDEIQFKELPKQPLRLFGLTYGYFLTLGGVIGALYILSFNTITRNEIPPIVITDSSQFAQDVPLQRGVILPPVDVMKAAEPTAEAVTRGAQLFKTTCASCHGDDGTGNGVSAAAMKVKPRNFHSAEGWKFGRKISQMFRTLQNGIPESGMPAFNYSPPADLFAIIHFVRTFAPDFPKDSTSDLMELEKIYALSKGKQLPAQIPVDRAMQLVIAEHVRQTGQASRMASALSGGNAENRGAAIASKVCLDRMKLAAAALHAKGKTLDEFVRTVEAGPVMIGFKPDVLRLSADEWGSLFAYLSAMNGEQKGS